MVGRDGRLPAPPIFMEDANASEADALLLGPHDPPHDKPLTLSGRTEDSASSIASTAPFGDEIGEWPKTTTIYD